MLCGALMTLHVRSLYDGAHDECTKTHISRKTRTFLDNGEMKVGEFQKEIGVTSRAYSMFMGQNGTYKGSRSSVYSAASAFFKKRELRGIKVKPNKKAKTTGAAGSAEATVPSLEGVEIEGEKEDKAPVYGMFGFEAGKMTRANDK